jgi:hypothetical protein
MNYIASTKSNSNNLNSSIGSVGTETSYMFSASSPINMQSKQSGGHLSYTNNTEGTFLHYVVANYKQIPCADELLKVILSNDNVKNFIDVKDKDGNTALHISAREGQRAMDMHDLATSETYNKICVLLIEHGANKQIKNNNEEVVGTDTEQIIPENLSAKSMSKPQSKPNSNMSIFSMPSLNAQSNTNPMTSQTTSMPSSLNLSTIGSMGSVTNKNSKMSSNETMNLNDQPNPEGHNEFLSLVTNAFNFRGSNSSNKSSRPISNQNVGYGLETSEPSGMTDTMMNEHSDSDDKKIDTEDFINKLLNNSNVSRPVSRPVNGSVSRPVNGSASRPVSGPVSRPTSVLSSRPVSRQEVLAGGNRTVMGRRTMRTLSEYDDNLMSGGDSEDESNDSDDKSELSRLVKSQTTEIHERVIQKIMKLMDVPENVARNYKAFIYRKVKDEHPEMNGIDRANKMEEETTKKLLQSIDIDKVTRDIEEHLASIKSNDSSEKPKGKEGKDTKAKDTKAKDTKAKAPRKSKKDQESSTSVVSVGTENGHSDTSSYSDF